MTEIRKMQLAIVAMMKDLNSLLAENGIPYTLLGGSVLGAVRHRGFIPWDDDMNIGIMRGDFERAEKILSEFAPYTYESAEKHIVPDAHCAASSSALCYTAAARAAAFPHGCRRSAVPRSAAHAKREARRDLRPSYAGGGKFRPYSRDARR